MKIYNTLKREIEEFKPLKPKQALIYSCGPTVYDHIHIGNLRSFILADTLNRVLSLDDNSVEHVMNFTDVDDKTIKRSKEDYPDESPEQALNNLTSKYTQIFLDDMKSIGNKLESIKFIKATNTIQDMQSLIEVLYDQGFAYIADDGVYFSIDKYKASGKKYGQLLELNTENTSQARIDNDEYDKDSVHDFALWKKQKNEEPAWEFELDSHNLLGRPGWHIECSAMSVKLLGQPFDIHTGGVDLIFPHHENEIAQSTAGKDQTYAKYFVHNEHLLVDGKKMSKSLSNFFTLSDIREKGFEPLSFRLMILSSHYRSQANFTWENLESAANTLKNLYSWADMSLQNLKSDKLKADYDESLREIKESLNNDLGTPTALALLNGMANRTEELGADSEAISLAAKEVDGYLGLDLSKRKDINTSQKELLEERSKARSNKDWRESDKLRDMLNEQGIGVKDSPQGQVWYRL